MTVPATTPSSSATKAPSGASVSSSSQSRSGLVPPALATEARDRQGCRPTSSGGGSGSRGRGLRRPDYDARGARRRGFPRECHGHDSDHRPARRSPERAAGLARAGVRPAFRETSSCSVWRGRWDRRWRAWRAAHPTSPARRGVSSASRDSRIRASSRGCSVTAWRRCTAICSTPRAVAQLPDAPLVVYMAGRKFGSTGPGVAHVGHERRGSRSRERALRGQPHRDVFNRQRVRPDADERRRLARDRSAGAGRRVRDELPRRASASSSTSAIRIDTKTTILRLNYATEMRYGLLVDLARQVVSGHPVDVTMGYFNVIWQGDANAMALHSLAHASSPALVVNLAGPELLSVRETSQAIAARLGVAVSVHRARGARRAPERRIDRVVAVRPPAGRPPTG